METPESLIIDSDSTRIRAYIEALVLELRFPYIVIEHDRAMDVAAFEGMDIWRVLLLIHTAPPDARERAMRRTLINPTFPRSSSDEPT